MAWDIKQGTEQYNGLRGRKVWIVFVGLFAVLLLLHLYRWSQGLDAIYSSSGPAAMLLLSVGNLLPSRRLLYYLLITLSLLLLILACVVTTLGMIH
jgi:hypothetical protein